MKKPIKIIKNDFGTFWNANDGKETYSRDIAKLLTHCNILYTLVDETQSKANTEEKK